MNRQPRPSLAYKLFITRLSSLQVALVLLCALLSSLSFGCSTVPYTWASDIPAERAKPGVQRKTIESGDTVALTVVGQKILSASHIVGADGTIALPNVGSVAVSGRSIKEAEANVRARLAVILTEPQVSISVITRSIEVTILGEVRSPGKQLLKSGDGVASALALAGGLTEFANSKAIFLVRSNEPLRIRFRLDDLLRGGDSARAFALRDGDLLVIE